MTAALKKNMQTQDLGNGPVMRTLMRLSLPAIGMMFLNTLVFMVDSIFVSWLGEVQMAAMSLSLPIAMTFFAFMEGVGGGTTALVGQNLGRGNIRMARLIALSSLALAYTLSLFMTPLFFRGISTVIFNGLGAMKDPAVLESAYGYNFWWPVTAPFIAYTFICMCAFRCQGDTVTPLITMAISNIVNAILDPLFIFTFGLGIEGAAVATLAGRVCATVYIHRKMKRSSNIYVPLLPDFRSSLIKYWRKIFFIGFPMAISTASVALGFGMLNKLLASYGNYAVAALIMCIRIEDLSFTVIMGVCSALTPFLAFNYGKRDLKRMTEGIRAAVIIASAFMFTIGAVLFIFPHPFIALFRPSERTANLTVLAIRFAISAYPFIIVQFVGNSLFVATGYSAFGTVAQLVRSIFVRVPSAYLFASLWGDRGVWLFQPASWLFGAIVAGTFAVHLIRKIRKQFRLEAVRESEG